MKIDYELKSKILQNESDMLVLENQLRKKVFYGTDFEREMYVSYYASAMKDPTFSECHKINHAFSLRVRRLRFKIQSMLDSNKQCIFLTLTFNDNTLSNTTFDTRRRYVVRFLRSISDDFIANVDYGAQNEREHYHAVVVADNVDGSYWREHYGRINFEKIRYAPVKLYDISNIEWWDVKKVDEYVRLTRDNTDLLLAKYVSKLSNHAIKETTKRCSIIYSRVS